jgi:hypothetical protein
LLDQYRTVDVVVDARLHAIVAAIAGVVTLIVIVGVFEWSRHGPGYTRHPRWADSSRQRERPAARTCGDVRAGSAANVHHHVLDWIGAQGFSESDRAVLLEEDVRWGARLSHTWCEPCLLGLAMADTSEARAVRTACGDR